MDDEKLKDDATRALLQSQQNATQISDLAKTVTQLTYTLDEKFEGLRRDIQTARQAAAPNFAVLGVWAAIILGMIYFLWGREATQIEKKFDRVSGLIEHSEENSIKAIGVFQSSLERMENWQDDQTKAELQELRERRYNHNKTP